LSRPVKDTELRRLFPLYLHAVRIDLLPTSEEFTRGINWATHPVTSQVALLRRTISAQGELAWIAFDHVVTADEGNDGYRARSVPEELWAELISMLSPYDVFGVGITAYGHHELAAAVSAFSKASASENAPAAALALGLVLAEQHDVKGAKEAYQQAIDSGHADYKPLAAFNLGIILAEQEDTAGALNAYRQAIDSAHAQYAPAAAVALGILLTKQGDTAGARETYRQAIDSGHAEHAPAAAVALGVLLTKQGDTAGAREAYQQAIDSDCYPSPILFLEATLIVIAAVWVRNRVTVRETAAVSPSRSAVCRRISADPRMLEPRSSGQAAMRGQPASVQERAMHAGRVDGQLVLAGSGVTIASWGAAGRAAC
jgi:predicted negative regulator of RcsB-dependent stress response